ncbi:transposase [Bacillus sp. FSL K6-3431]|uniref:transposase n=1 Tax=Bacillus sp. FSL K6-3431 TaxID=2921500 RepID=UPI0030FA7C10
MSLTMLAREDSTQYIYHDQLFKQLIHTYFAEFLEVFFPEVHDQVDFSLIKPLSEEMYTDLIDGESRKADIVIETKLKGHDTLIIIHVEPQSYGQKDFNKRMYHYFSLLYNRYRKPILPIAIFSYDENRYECNEFTISFPFFHVLSFQFLLLELRKMNWRDYIHSNNPVAAVLMSKMRYTEKEKVQLKLDFLRMLIKMELDPAKAELINGFFESYLSLNEREEQALMEEMKQLTPDEADFLSKLPNSWKENGLKEAKKKVEEKVFKKRRKVSL